MPLCRRCRQPVPCTGGCGDRHGSAPHGNDAPRADRHKAWRRKRERCRRIDTLRVCAASGAASEQNRLLLVQDESIPRKNGTDQGLQSASFEVGEPAAFFANQVQLGFAFSRSRVTIPQFIVFRGSDNLNVSLFLQAVQAAIDGAQRNRR